MTMKADPVTGIVPLTINGETIDLRFTNSAFAYVEDEAGVDAAQDAIGQFLESAMAAKVRFSLVVAFGRAFLRAAGKDPNLVDDVKRDDLVAAVTALILSTIDPTPGATENPPKAAGRN
jgi:hypothetical protein